MLETQTILSHVPMILDGLIIVAVIGLWFAWWGNAKRQKRIEQLLKESARQLLEASDHLESALRHISNARKPSTDNAGTQLAERMVHQEPFEMENAQIARILRMEREGKSEEEIANELNVPLGQVRLAIKIHSRQSS